MLFHNHSGKTIFVRNHPHNGPRSWRKRSSGSKLRLSILKFPYERKILKSLKFKLHSLQRKEDTEIKAKCSVLLIMIYMQVCTFLVVINCKSNSPPPLLPPIFLLQAPSLYSFNKDGCSNNLCVCYSYKNGCS